MGAAQDAFAGLCGSTTYGDYCGSVWEAPDDICCGICPSGAISAYGTVTGVTINSLFSMMIVLFQTGRSGWWIVWSLAFSAKYLVAIFIRNIMGTASDGVNAIQKWQTEFAFLMAAGMTGVIFGAVFPDTHHIHGFGTPSEFNDYLDADRDLAIRRLNNEDDEKLYGTHPRQRQEHDSKVQRLRKWCQRSQAKLVLWSFASTELFWFIVYASTIWFRDGSTFWQSNCDDTIGTFNYWFMRGVSITFVSLAFLATILLWYPAYHSPTSSEFRKKLNLRKKKPEQEKKPIRVRSAAQLVLRILHIHDKEAETGKVRIQGDGAPLIEETSDERTLKIASATVIWTFWFGSTIIILFKALNDFLLIGSQPWPYAATQNMVWGIFPALRFLYGPIRTRRQGSKRARRAAAKANATSPTANEEERGDIPKPPKGKSHSHKAPSWHRTPLEVLHRKKKRAELDEGVELDDLPERRDEQHHGSPLVAPQENREEEEDRPEWPLRPTSRHERLHSDQGRPRPHRLMSPAREDDEGYDKDPYGHNHDDQHDHHGRNGRLRIRHDQVFENDEEGLLGSGDERKPSSIRHGTLDHDSSSKGKHVARSPSTHHDRRPSTPFYEQEEAHPAPIRVRRDRVLFSDDSDDGAGPGPATSAHRKEQFRRAVHPESFPQPRPEHHAQHVGGVRTVDSTREVDRERRVRMREGAV